MGIYLAIAVVECMDDFFQIFIFEFFFNAIQEVFKTLFRSESWRNQTFTYFMLISLFWCNYFPLQNFVLFQSWDSLSRKTTVDKKFLLGMDNIDIMQIVEILPVESSKNKHTTSQKTSTMSSSCFRHLSLYFSSCYLISSWI